MSNFLNFAGNSGVTFKSFTASGGTTYTLDVSSSTNSLMVSIGGVLQKPVTDYTVSGTTLTTTDTIASGIVIDTYVIHNAGGTTPIIEDNSVTTAKILDNNVTGAKIAMGSDAAGDILYYNGTDYVRLGKGTTGHYLSQGGSNAPAWSAVSAGFTLTAEQATTSGSGITFGSIPSGVQHVVMMVEGTSPGSDGDIYIQLGDGGGLETSGYIASGGYVLQVGTTGVTRSTSSFIWRMEGQPAWTYDGAMQFFLKDATNNTWVAVQGGSHGGGSSRQATVGGGVKSLSAALTQIKVFPQTGDFDAGSISIMYM